MGTQKSLFIYYLFRRHSMFPYVLRQCSFLSYWTVNYCISRFFFFNVSFGYTYDHNGLQNLCIKMDNALRVLHSMDGASFVIPKGLFIFSEESSFEYLCHGGKAVSISQLVPTLLVLFKTSDDCWRNINQTHCLQTLSKNIEP